MKKPSPQEIEQIVKGCQRNDRNSQKILYMSYYSTLLPLCARYTSNMEEARDLLHDAFLKIFEQIKKYKSQGSFEGWLKAVVVNYAIDFYRRKKKMRLLSADDEENPIPLKAETTETEEEQTFEQISPQQLLEAIQKLPDAYRMVFCLYYLENLSHKEIAEKLNINEGTSKSNLFKAKNKLKNILSKKIQIKNP